MGILNRILPKRLKPISRDIGFTINSCIYKLNCIGKKPHSSPIFILGNQKSGTSAIAALLGELSGKDTAIDLYYSGFRYSHFKDWKRGKLNTKQFINKNKIEFSFEILKEPHFSVFFKELKQEFIEAKFVMIVRDPLDNIRSILDRLNIDGDKKNLEKEDKKKIFHSWNLLFNNDWIGGSKKQYIEVLAERWNIISKTYLENKNNIILVKYEDFLKDKIKVINNLSRELNIEKVNDISSLLNTQFQPVGKNKKVDVQEFFKEKNYQKILSICKENMERLVY